MMLDPNITTDNAKKKIEAINAERKVSMTSMFEDNGANQET